MERSDLLEVNNKIFSEIGKILNETADPSTLKCLIVGNPANTNALITAANAPKLSYTNFNSMMMLDYNRGISQLAMKAKCHLNEISNFIVWGNHSPTMYPDISHCTIKGVPASEVINDNQWVENTFIPIVQNRGAQIIETRGSSSAASAASAAIDHLRTWYYGSNGKVVSFGVFSHGEYGSFFLTFFGIGV